MNNEQIKEVMRLSDDIRTAHTSEWDVPDLVEAQNDLEAYLRTIGEPENTFPLNPNGSSKWAHLQKHDGAEAIGVVFRTGSGSVGSLVDGRVVWADWLAHPTGSKPESVNAELLDADLCQIVGIKADGSETVLGSGVMPPKMKAMELLNSYGFNPDDEYGEGGYAMSAVEDLIDWMVRVGWKAPALISVKQEAYEAGGA